MDITDLYQDLIIDHGTKPRNFCCLENPTNSAEGFNPLCGDKIKLFANIKSNLIQDISFTGNGCAISIASASIMSEILKGKTIQQAKDIFENFQSLVTSDKNTPDELKLGKLAALAGVRKFPTRVKCATLAWHTFLATINNNLNITSTE